MFRALKGTLEDLDRVQSHDEDFNGHTCLFFGPPPLRKKQDSFFLSNMMDDLSQQSILAKLKINK